jgi:hypothetical protein
MDSQTDGHDARPAHEVSPYLAFGVSLFGLVAIWREFTYQGLLPLPILLLPVLSVSGLALSILAVGRTRTWYGRVVAVVSVLTALASCGLVALALFFVVVFRGP